MPGPLIQRHLVIRSAILLLALVCRPVGSDGGDTPQTAAPSLIKSAELFNGHDLKGWEPVGNGGTADWTVEDGCLVCRGKGHTWLRTERQYVDFHFSLEYLVSPGANSGVYVRVGADGNHHRENAAEPPAGFEVQILDDRSPRYRQLKDYQYSASVYDIAGAAPRVSKGAGEWNSLEIDCAGDHVTIRHNGKRVVDATPKKYPLLALRNKQGYLGLQSHNGVVRFRNLRISPPNSR